MGRYIQLSAWVEGEMDMIAKADVSGVNGCDESFSVMCH